MGLPIATRLASVLERLNVSDLAPGRVAEALAAAPQASDAGDGWSDADTIFLCLPSSAATRAALAELPSDQRQRTVIDFGAHGAAFVAELSESCAARQTAYCDAPVFGTPSMAERGDLYFLFSGPEPVFRFFSNLVVQAGFRTRRAGTTGTASTVKVLQNALGTANLAAAAEVLRLCEASDIPPDLFADIVDECGGIGRSTVFQRFADDMAARRDSGEGRLRIAAKDMASVTDLAERLGVATPVLRQTAQLFAEAMGKDMGDRQFTDIIDLHATKP